jgi:CBS domain-containing protein
MEGRAPRRTFAADTAQSEEEAPMTAPTSGPPAFEFDTFTVLNGLQLGLIECPADTDLRSVARMMSENTVHSVIVRGDDPDDWRILSDLDLMAGLRTGLAGATAGQLAASDWLVVNPADTLAHAAQLMVEHQTAHAVVVDPVTGRPIGILSTLDIARFLAG